jgi:hypothetical protein
VSGSGIASLASKPETLAMCASTPGTCDLDLFAPQGAIDAGDAGLRSLGSVNLGAQRILNATNIQAAGSISGAPAAVGAPPAPAVAANNAATQQTDTQASDIAKANRESRQGILTVEVLATGDGAAPAAEDQEQEDDKKKKKKNKG